MLFAAAVSYGSADLTVQVIYSADYCDPCKQLRRDLAAHGATLNLVPVTQMPASITDYPTVFYSDGSSDTGTIALRLPRSAFKKTIPDYELVTR